MEVYINVAMKFTRFLPLYLIISFGTLLSFRVRARYITVDPTDPNQITYFNTSFALGVAQLILLNIVGTVNDMMGLGDQLTSANMVNYALYLMYSFMYFPI